MSFTRDYVITTPIDHTLNQSWPDYDRRTKQDVQDRLATIISGFASGETVVGVLNLPFIAVSAPSTVTDQIQLYGKVVSTKTELHAKDEDGNEVQLTSGGKINTLGLSASVAALANLLPYIYPIGTVLTFGVSTNPATLLGFGTWTAIAGKVIVGIDAGQTEFDTLNETGGAKTQSLSTANLPNNLRGITVGGGTYELPTGGADTLVTGTGTAFSILPPYIVKYVWERTA
jgi:hypothetical protein